MDPLDPFPIGFGRVSAHFDIHSNVNKFSLKSALIQYEPQHESVTRPNLGATKRPGLTILSNANVPAAISVLEAKVADTLTCIMHSNHAQRHCRHYVISPGMCSSPAHSNYKPKATSGRYIRLTRVKLDLRSHAEARAQSGGQLHRAQKR